MVLGSGRCERSIVSKLASIGWGGLDEAPLFGVGYSGAAEKEYTLRSMPGVVADGNADPEVESGVTIESPRGPGLGAIGSGFAVEACWD